MVTVLIVDDDPKLLNMLRRTLRYEGFRVLSSTNGNEALAELRARRPDVVILDWFMPRCEPVYHSGPEHRSAIALLLGVKHPFGSLRLTTQRQGRQHPVSDGTLAI